MLILPSVGCKVTQIRLNESATKAKLYFNDGTTAIISTQGTVGTTSAPTKSIVTESRKTVKRVVRKPVTESAGVRIIKTSQGPMQVPVGMTEARQKQLEEQKIDVIERAKKRCAMLESKTLTASDRLGMDAKEGDEVSVST